MLRKDVQMGEHPFEQKTPPKPMAPNAYHEYVRESLESFSGAAAEINKMTGGRIRNVPEPYFRTKLLNIVRAWVTKAKPEPEIGLWLNVADGLHNHINVVDEQGEILFTVPPPFVDIELNTTDFKEARKNSIINAVNLQGLHADNGDRKKFWDMETELIEGNKAKPAEHSMAEAMTQLVKMYRYYDLPLVEILGEDGAAQIAPLLEKEAAASLPSADNGSDDDPDAFEY